MIKIDLGTVNFLGCDCSADCTDVCYTVIGEEVMTIDWHLEVWNGYSQRTERFELSSCHVENAEPEARKRFKDINAGHDTYFCPKLVGVMDLSVHHDDVS